jgi:hypothetical protein
MGLPESMEEFVSAMIQAYPELLPDHRPLAVAWGRPNPRYVFTGCPSRDGDRAGYTIFVSDEWWDSEPRGREYDFVVGMLASRYREKGRLNDMTGVLRLEVEGTVLWNDDAQEYLLDEAAEIMNA